MREITRAIRYARRSSGPGRRYGKRALPKNNEGHDCGAGAVAVPAFGAADFEGTLVVWRTMPDADHPMLQRESRGLKSP